MEEMAQNQDLENKEVNTGNTPEAPKKKGIKGFLQLILFILLSMAGFIVQVVIEQLKKLSIVQNFDNAHSFVMFDITYLTGSFIVTMIAIFVCKVINFILHRKVLFKPRHNLAFGIAMYVVFSVLLWLGSVSIQQPVKNAFVDASWWTNSLFKGNVKTATDVADFLATMVYSTADLIIMFFAEKFLIMNDKLFQKKGQEAVEAPATENAAPAEEAVAADNAVAQEAAPVAEEKVAEESVVATEEVKAEEVVAQEPAVEEVKAEEPVAEEVVEEVIEEVVEEVAEETPVEEVATEEVAAEEVAPEAPAKKPAAKKTTSTATKKPATTAKTTAAKKTTSTAAKKPATTAKTTTAKKTTSTAAKKPATTAKKTTKK